MKTNKKRIVLVASVLALSALLIFAGAAFAMGRGPGGSQNASGAYANTPTAGAYGNGATNESYGMGVRGAWAGGEGSLVDTAAQVMGLERIDLVTELAEGISIADAAANHGVDAQAIADAYLAARTDFLAQLVADGRLSQDQADQMLAEMMDNVLVDLSEPWEARAGASSYDYGNGANWGDDDFVSGSGALGQAEGLEWLDAGGDGECDNYDGTPQGQRSASNTGGRGGRWNR